MPIECLSCVTRPLLVLASWPSMPVAYQSRRFFSSLARLACLASAWEGSHCSQPEHVVHVAAFEGPECHYHGSEENATR